MKFFNENRATMLVSFLTILAVWVYMVRVGWRCTP